MKKTAFWAVFFHMIFKYQDCIVAEPCTGVLPYHPMLFSASPPSEG